jgi:hypothetical protein
MKNRTLLKAIGSTLSEEKQIENGVVQGAVLSVTLFLVPMADITHGIEEIGYTTHKHEWVCIVKLLKAMNKIVKWADQTTPAFKSQMKKSRKNTAIASRSRLDKWIKGMKIEQVRKQWHFDPGLRARRRREALCALCQGFYLDIALFDRISVDFE